MFSHSRCHCYKFLDVGVCVPLHFGCYCSSLPLLLSFASRYYIWSMEENFFPIIIEKHPHVFANNFFGHQYLGEANHKLLKCAYISQNYSNPVLLAEVGWARAGYARQVLRVRITVTAHVWKGTKHSKDKRPTQKKLDTQAILQELYLMTCSKFFGASCFKACGGLQKDLNEVLQSQPPLTSWRTIIDWPRPRVLLALHRQAPQCLCPCNMTGDVLSTRTMLSSPSYTAFWRAYLCEAQTHSLDPQWVTPPILLLAFRSQKSLRKKYFLFFYVPEPYGFHFYNKFLLWKAMLLVVSNLNLQNLVAFKPPQSLRSSSLFQYFRLQHITHTETICP